jgi:fructosamine-3-kinase
LWGGNAGFDASGAPVVFDPAVSFGDRETDLAFTKAFGGFGEAFYRGYREAWPMPDGWRDREPVYNLYHVLNHALLFGGSYGVEAQRVIDRFG